MATKRHILVRRRSERLYTKQHSEALFSACHGPRGIFCLLPMELHQEILHHLSHSDLAKLSTTSHVFALVVREHIVSGKHLETLLFPSAEPETTAANQLPHPAGILATKFASLGNLLRSVACLMPTKEKFRLLTIILSKLQSVHSVILTQSGSSTAYHCFGALLKQLVRNWSFSDKRCVFQLIWQEAAMETRCKLVFSAEPGSHPLHELDLRLLIRNVFLSYEDLSACMKSSSPVLPEDYLCWLTLLMKAWPLVHQARLLVMLFGPLHHYTGSIDWQKLCSPFTGSGCGKQDLAELAFVMSALYVTNSLHKHTGQSNVSRQLDWIEDQVVSIVDEATALPQGWSLDNMGQLLQQLCRPLTVNLLQCYAANGRLAELAHLILHLAIVCADDDPGPVTKHTTDGDLTYFVSILHDVLRIFQVSVRKQFLQQFYLTWQEHIMDTFQVSEDAIPMNQAVNRITRMCEVLSHQLFIHCMP